MFGRKYQWLIVYFAFYLLPVKHATGPMSVVCGLFKQDSQNECQGATTCHLLELILFRKASRNFQEARNTSFVLELNYRLWLITWNESHSFVWPIPKCVCLCYLYFTSHTLTSVIVASFASTNTFLSWSQFWVEPLWKQEYTRTRYFTSKFSSANMCTGKCSRFIAVALYPLALISIICNIVLFFPGWEVKYAKDGHITEEVKYMGGLVGGGVMVSINVKMFLCLKRILKRRLNFIL